MGRKIRTRTVRKDIKALDKLANITNKIRRSYVRTKDRMKFDYTKEQSSPVNYAEDNIKSDAYTLGNHASRQIMKACSSRASKIKEKQNLTKDIRHIEVKIKEEHVEQSGSGFSFLLPDEEKGSKTIQKLRNCPKGHYDIKTIQNTEIGQQASRAIMQREELKGKSIKLSVSRDKGGKVVWKIRQTKKNTGKRTVKNSGKSIKTAKTTVKSTEHTAKVTREAVKISSQTVATSVKAIIASTRLLSTVLLAGGGMVLFILVIVIMFGGFLCMSGGDNSITVIPVTVEVQAYEPIIRKYAKQYGIAEYVELIKAVMMQESGGIGADPMQSSENGFNIKYPRQPNGITDPEYSIDCGVQEIKSCLVSAEARTPVDMAEIKLALQGYNFGNGYIFWAKTSYGGYTLANAAEFSEKMAEEKGWSSYGDKQYVPHVLRYYALGRIPSKVGCSVIVQTAISQEGNGGETYWSWYGFESRVPWCACFVSWCAEQCGYLNSGVFPRFSLCSDGVSWFQQAGRFMDASYVPASGDIIFFDWGNDGSIDHVGIVEYVSKGVVYTVEGNSGDLVKRNCYSIGDSQIYGYGIY